MFGNRRLPLAFTTGVALAFWALAAANGYAWQLISLPAAVAGAAWPGHRTHTLDNRFAASGEKASDGNDPTRRDCGRSHACTRLRCAADASQSVTPEAIPPATVSSPHRRIAYSTRAGDISVMNPTQWQWPPRHPLRTRHRLRPLGQVLGTGSGSPNGDWGTFEQGV
jgi:hypothetical protein